MDFKYLVDNYHVVISILAAIPCGFASAFIHAFAFGRFILQYTMLLLILLALPLLFFVFLEIKYHRAKQLLKQVAGPPTIPILGNAHQIGNTPHVTLFNFFKWWKEFDYKNYRIWIGYIPNILITEPKDVEYILTSNSLIDKSDVYDMLHPWLGTGLLTATGNKWFKHRKMITPSFHFKILQHFHEIMNTNSNKFIEKLTLASAGETIFDFQEMVHYLTLDVICDTAMGVNINAMDNHEAEIVQAFKDMCYIINMRAFHPIKRYNSLFRYCPGYSDFAKTLKILQDFTNDVIEKRIQALKEIDAQSEAAHEEDEFSRSKMAFLDTLLKSTIDGRPLTQYEIYEEVSTFMFEGHDTTTSGVAFAVHLISRHPEIQKKIYEEQKYVLGGNLKRDATFQEVSEMKYLDMVVKEAQRLYPSVPVIGRFADKEYNMNGVIIPRTTSVNIFIMSLGYNEATFADPYKVDPERFDVDKQTEKKNPFGYVPFSAGPRNCIGQKFAVLEIKTVVSKIVRAFEVLPAVDELISKDGYVEHTMGKSIEEQEKRPPHKYDPKLSAVLTLKSENGIQIRLRARK